METCIICNCQFDKIKKLISHLRYKHRLSVREYYDEFLKSEKSDGICPTCGKQTKFLGLNRGYSKHCSCKCSAIDNETKIKREQTNLDIFGATYPAKSEPIKKKMSDTFTSKYGTSWGFQSDIVKNKITETFLDRYGVSSPFQLPDVRDKATSAIRENREEINLKIAATSLAKYGETSWTKTEIGRKRISEMAKNPNTIRKKTETMHRNNSFKFSSCEEILYDKLVELFGVNNVKREYFSSDYPYKCDFYVVPIDTYIEYNGFWHHGGHWFDNTNKDDVKLLEEWKIKAKDSENYKKAVYTWSIRDLEKRTCAINNNINYIVLWNTKEISSLSF